MVKSSGNMPISGQAIHLHLHDFLRIFNTKIQAYTTIYIAWKLQQ